MFSDHLMLDSVVDQAIDVVRMSNHFMLDRSPVGRAAANRSPVDCAPVDRSPVDRGGLTSRVRTHVRLLHGPDNHPRA